MNPVPDLSYFTVPGFIENMRIPQMYSSSLILQNGRSISWEIALSDEDGSLYRWLHENTGNKHNVYLPFTANEVFLEHYKCYVKDLVEPAKNRIYTFLKEFGVIDVDEYMEDSDEWLYLLFVDSRSHHAAAEIAAINFAIEPNSLPAIIIWDFVDNKSVIEILPHLSLKDINMHYMNLQDYIKDIYRAILKATDVLSNPLRSTNLKSFREEIEIQFAEFNLTDNRNGAVRKIGIKNFNQRVADILRLIGAKYSNQYNESIMNFEKHIRTERVGRSFVKYASSTHKKLKRNLNNAGFKKVRDGSNHEIWYNKFCKKRVQLPRHKKISPLVAWKVGIDIQAALNVS